jgi:hypothetical protein
MRVHSLHISQNSQTVQLQEGVPESSMDLQRCILVKFMNSNICLQLEDLLLLGVAVPVWNRGCGNCGASAQVFCDSKTAV